MTDTEAHAHLIEHGFKLAETSHFGFITLDSGARVGCLDMFYRLPCDSKDLVVTPIIQLVVKGPYRRDKCHETLMQAICKYNKREIDRLPDRYRHPKAMWNVIDLCS